jgi:hypothetical protein
MAIAGRRTTSRRPTSTTMKLSAVMIDDLVDSMPCASWGHVPIRMLSVGSTNPTLSGRPGGAPQSVGASRCTTEPRLKTTPSRVPTSRSRPTTGSRKPPSTSRTHEMRIRGHSRRTRGSTAR